jgi:hypothetical protein
MPGWQWDQFTMRARRRALAFLLDWLKTLDTEDHNNLRNLPDNFCNSLK